MSFLLSFKRKTILTVVLFLFSFFQFNETYAAVLLPGNISTCGELAAPGTYTLTQNISGGADTCFTISSDNVTINGGGYTISGTGDVALDARARTGGPSGSLTEGAHAYTNLILNDLNISGYTTGLNISGNEDTTGTGQNNGFGGDAGDVAIFYSYIGSITSNGGDTTTQSYGGVGGNISFTDTNLSIASSTISVLGGEGITGEGSRGGLDLNYTGTLTKTNLTLSALAYFNDNSAEYGIYPGGTWPLFAGPLSTCGTLYATTTATFTLTQDLTSDGTCFIIAGDDITLDGDNHSVTAEDASSTDWAIDASIHTYENLKVKNLNFYDFSNIINSSSTVELETDTDLDLSNQTIRAASLVLKYIGNITYTNTIFSNLTSLIVNNIQYGNFSEGLVSAFQNVWNSFSGLGVGDWKYIASSSDGKYVYAVSGSTTGKLFKSSDYGKTFELVTSVPNSTYLGFVATSADGKYILLLKTTSTSDVYISSDYGNTWTVKNTGHGSVRSGVVSADGSKMMTVSWDKKVTISTDYGVNWTTQNTSSYIYWESIKGNGDLSKLIAVGGVGNVVSSASGYLYTSNDFGVTWATSTSAGFKMWRDVDVSADWNKIIATTGANSVDGYIYVSSNGGTTWATSTSAGLKRWTSVGMTSDGERMIAAVGLNQHIYVSSNGGTTWATSTSALATKTWATSHITKDGSRMFGAVASEYLYSFVDFPADIHNAIVTPTASSTVQEWAPVIVWGSASKCYYSYDNWTSTSTAECTLNGSDIEAPSAGETILSIKSYGDGGIFEKTVNFNYEGNNIEIISPSSSQTSYKSSTWSPEVNYNKGNELNISDCYYSYDNWISTSTANCSLDGSDILPPPSSGLNILSIKVVDDEESVYTKNENFIYEIDYLYGSPTIVGTKNWQQIYTLSDPNKLIAASTDYLFTSSDGGTTWATSTASLGTKTWEFITASLDGQKIFATVNNEYIYRSLDYGLSWSVVSSSLGTKDWNSIAATGDGATVYAAVFNNYIYKSTDSGTTWATSTASLGTKLWYDVAVTPDNSVIFAVADTGYIYKSVDGGTTWATSTAFPTTKSWRSISVSEDGTKVVAASNNDYIYKSSNSGFTWATSTASLGTKNWTTVEMSASGDDIVASPSSGYTYISNDSGTTWATSTWVSTNAWNGVAIAKDASRIFAFLNANIYRTITNGLSWFGGNLNYSWQNSFISSDGSKMIIANSSSGYVYTSTDGVNWTERQGTGQKNWYALAASSDGMNVFAAASGNYIFKSSNGGETWATSTLSLGTKNWRSLASSADGTVLYAGIGSGSGYIYKSVDGGTTWATSTGSGLRQWYGIDTNSNGTKVAAAVNGGYLYTSSDGGANWTTLTNITSYTMGLYDVAMSENGSKLVVVGNDLLSGYVVISNDGGSTWTRQTGLGSKYWTTVDMSSDGSIIRVAARDPDPGYIYTSYDGGVTWVQHTALGNKDWYDISMSSDGKKFVAAAMSSPPYFYDGNVDMIDFSVSNPIEGENYSVSNWDPEIDFSDAVDCSYSYNNWFSSTTIDCENNGSDISNPPVSGSLTLSIKAVSYNGSEREKEITFSFNNTNYVYQWVQRTLAGTYVWRGIVSSLNGLKLAAIAGNNYIHTSSNGGSTWLTSTASLGTKGWYDLAASYDGNKIIGVTFGNNVYRTTNGGSTWESVSTSFGVKNWRSVAMSGNGDNVIVTVEGGNIYKSSDGGTTWATSTSAGSRNWRATASSFDGTKMFASVWAGHIYKSSDGGTTWATSTTSLGTKSWYEIGVSADGNIIYATTEGSGYMYKSSDGGTTWATSTSLGIGYWGDIKTSADGSRVIVAKYSDYMDSVYISDDYGNTWSSQSVSGPKYIQTVNISYDGTKFFAGNARATTNATGYIYTTTKTPAEVNVDILAPSASSTLTNWSPVVSWGAATQCYYSYDNWASTSTADCSLNGSDIQAPDDTGELTLYIKGKNSVNENTDTRTFTMQAYYFCGTSDEYWSNASNWYTDESCTVNTGSIPTTNDIASLVGSVSPIINSSVPNLSLKIISSTLSGSAQDAGVIFTDDTVNSTRIIGNATFNDTSHNEGVITGNAIFNTTYYSGSVPTDNYLQIGQDGYWTGDVQGTLYSSDGVTAITKIIFGNGSSGNYGTIRVDVDFNAQTIYSLGTIVGTTTLNGTNQSITYNENNYLNNLIKIVSSRDTLSVLSGIKINVSGLLKIYGLNQNSLLTIKSLSPSEVFNLNINGTADLNYLRLKNVANNGDVIDLSDRVVFDDGGNSGFNFKENSTAGSRGGITGSYTPPALPPSRGGETPGGEDPGEETPGEDTGGGSTEDGLLRNIIRSGIRPINFNPIPSVNLINQGFNPQFVGTTIIPNPLQNFQPPGLVNLSQLPSNFLKSISRFLFAPIPKTITDALNEAPLLQTYMASVGISREQDLATLSASPIKLTNPSTDQSTPPGLFIIYSGETPISSYATYEQSAGGLVQMVKVSPNQLLHVSLIPQSTGDVRAQYLGQNIQFVQGSQFASASIESPSTGGRYILKTVSSPIALVIEVIEPIKVEELKKENIFIRAWNWIKAKVI